MRKETITLLVVLLVLASGMTGYLAGVTSQSGNHTTTLPNVLYQRIILAASCSPVGNTGAIIAINTGDIPVNLTEVTISDSSGIHIGAAFQHGIIINTGNYATLSQGIAYSGSNVTIGTLTKYGGFFTTLCHGVSD